MCYKAQERGGKKMIDPKKEKSMKEAVELMKQLKPEDLQKIKGVITGIKLARDVEKAG